MKTSHIVRLATGLLAAIAAVAVACGGGGKSTNTPVAGATTSATKSASATTPAATAAATKAASATSSATKTAGGSSTPRSDVDSLEVTAKDFSFTLNLTSVRPGAPGVDVTFKNDGATTHTLTFYEDAEFTKKIGGSGNIAAGQTGGFPFLPPADATTIYYRCDIHTTQMKGELAVKP